VNMSEEIHSIKSSIIDLQKAINGLVRKFGNISVLENQQENDRGAVDKLSEEVDKLAEVIISLNTNVATMNGIAAGKRTMWAIFGGLTCLAVVGVVTTVILHNSTLDVHSSELKAFEARVKALEAK